MKRLGRVALLLGGAGCYQATFIRDPGVVKAEEGLVQFLTFQIYNPQGVTIRCAGR